MLVVWTCASSGGGEEGEFQVCAAQVELSGFPGGLDVRWEKRGVWCVQEGWCCHQLRGLGVHLCKRFPEIKT